MTVIILHETITLTN